MSIKYCLVCGCKYITERTNSKYCSKKCSMEAVRKFQRDKYRRKKGTVRPYNKNKGGLSDERLSQLREKYKNGVTDEIMNEFEWKLSRNPVFDFYNINK